MVQMHYQNVTLYILNIYNFYSRNVKRDLTNSVGDLSLDSGFQRKAATKVIWGSLKISVHSVNS
jgi:hypothetical protein